MPRWLEGRQLVGVSDEIYLVFHRFYNYYQTESGYTTVHCSSFRLQCAVASIIGRNIGALAAVEVDYLFYTSF
jgi:hypothetical protein